VSGDVDREVAVGDSEAEWRVGSRRMCFAQRSFDGVAGELFMRQPRR
jgi:hypothetical protein